MDAPDPASLQNLNDIVLPDDVGWWPLAPGWYVLAGLLAALLAWLAYRSWKRWTRNRYRRMALAELDHLADAIRSGQQRDDCLRRTPVLLKRTALAAYPRKRVAGLSGLAWRQFLNETLHEPVFTNAVAETLDEVTYSAGALDHVDSRRATALVDAARHWLRHHATTFRGTGV